MTEEPNYKEFELRGIKLEMNGRGDDQKVTRIRFIGNPKDITCKPKIKVSRKDSFGIEVEETEIPRREQLPPQIQEWAMHLKETGKPIKMKVLRQEFKSEDSDEFYHWATLPQLEKWEIA